MSPEPDSYGPIYTRGRSFRARAEARQRRYRAEVLGAGWDTHGHWLDAAAADAGANFVVPEAHAAARRRDAAGKGVGSRTFQNMLASQALCFNLFAPLAVDLDLATAVLAPLVHGLARVRAITIEHTPEPDVFGDQTGRGGVDCDVLVEAVLEDGQDAVLVIETKLVETEFSTCGFRRPGRAAKGRAVCPEGVPVGRDRDTCGYHQKGYAYWQRADELGTLRPLPERGCPFGGPGWQLWVNHTLAHVEARRRGARHARFLVCAPSENRALLREGEVLDRFRAVVADPATVAMLPLDDLIERITVVEGEASAWVRGLRGRYARI